MMLFSVKNVSAQFDSIGRGASIGGFFDKIYDMNGKSYPLASMRLPNAQGLNPNNPSAKMSSQNGTVVFNARVMHNLLNPAQFTMYANNCPSTSNKMADADDEQQNLLAQFTVYPNPASNGFNIKSNHLQNANLEVSLIDMRGKLILNQICYYQGKDCYIGCSVADGIYIVKIKNLINNEIHFVKLQVLQH